MKKIIVPALFFAMLAQTPVYAASVLMTAGGKLIGVSGVEFDARGSHWNMDVTFIDGSCAALFSGCDSQQDSPFNLILDSANQALLPLLGTYSDSPQLFRGCESVTECRLTGVGNVNQFGIGGSTLLIQAGPGNDFGISESNIGGGPTYDLTGVTNRTYAVWTATPPVPLPAAVWLLLSGLGAVAMTRVRSLHRPNWTLVTSSYATR
jgi:hypothetical protein